MPASSNVVALLGRLRKDVNTARRDTVPRGQKVWIEFGDCGEEGDDCDIKEYMSEYMMEVEFREDPSFYKEIRDKEYALTGLTETTRIQGMMSDDSRIVPYDDVCSAPVPAPVSAPVSTPVSALVSAPPPAPVVATLALEINVAPKNMEEAQSLLDDVAVVAKKEFIGDDDDVTIAVKAEVKRNSELTLEAEPSAAEAEVLLDGISKTACGDDKKSCTVSEVKSQRRLAIFERKLGEGQFGTCIHLCGVNNSPLLTYILQATSSSSLLLRCSKRLWAKKIWQWTNRITQQDSPS